MHTELVREHVYGNNGIGRVFFLPGSSGRAREIYEHFDVQDDVHTARRVELKSYFGQLRDGDRKIDVASLATGMGCPSATIVLGELLSLGATRFIRIGSAGSLVEYIRVPDVVIVKESYKDEGTSINYLPPNWPARASYNLLRAAIQAAEVKGFGINKDGHPKAHVVVGHTKDDLWQEGFDDDHRWIKNPYRRQRINTNWPKVKRQCQSTSMEESALYIFTEMVGIDDLVERGLYRYEDFFYEKDDEWHMRPDIDEEFRNKTRYEAISLCGIVGDVTPYADLESMLAAEENAIIIGLETARQRSKMDLVASR